MKQTSPAATPINDRAARTHEAGGRRDGAESGDHAGDDAQTTGFAVAHPLQDHPGERAGGGAEVRHPHRHAALPLAVKRTAAR